MGLTSHALSPRVIEEEGRGKGQPRASPRSTTSEARRGNERVVRRDGGESEECTKVVQVVRANRIRKRLGQSLVPFASWLGCSRCLNNSLFSSLSSCALPTTSVTSGDTRVILSQQRS